MEIRRGVPAGVFAWSRTARSPGAPATFAAHPDQVALGQALALRVTAATRMTAEAVAAAGLLELASHRFAKLIHDVHNLTTRAIARFLVTGQGTSDTERRFLGRLGVIAAAHGLSSTTLNRSYFLWRDTNLRILNEEATRLGTAAAVAEEARMIIRSSADTGILRIARAYDDQMHVILARGATPIALHNGHAHLNGRTVATAEVANAVRSLA
ncbi:MAG TPA: hypothetical protein VF956_01155 [Candidatus Dormibacteraeota bacterium]